MGAGVSQSRTSSRAEISRNSSLETIKDSMSKSKENGQKFENGGTPSTLKDNKPITNSSTENNSDKNDESKAKKSQKKEKESPGDIDIMISYSHADTEFMKKIKAGLEKEGITVWVDITGLKAGVDFLSKIGQAIIDAKMFLQLLSTSCIKSKYCQDELALAYVSNKPIFPVGLQKPSELFPVMDTGMKLQLARFNWNLFTNSEAFTEDMKSLVEKLTTFKKHGKCETSLETEKSVDKGHTRSNVNSYLQKKTSFDMKMEAMTDSEASAAEAISGHDDVDFWKEHFKNKTSVPWTQFADTSKKKYKKRLAALFSESDQDWLERIIHRELVGDDEDDTVIKLEGYIDFCTVDDEMKSFWDRIQDQAVESYTMKEVFDMNSSVRVEAIENLGKFRSKAVVEALMDLLHDKDNNIRAVAAISLARTGEDSPHVIKELIKCLSDGDRLVREGACLALGHLKAFQAVQKILHLWRNDFISHVREAAQVALELIGGTEANKAMYITKVLSDEIRMLTKE